MSPVTSGNEIPSCGRLPKPGAVVDVEREVGRCPSPLTSAITRKGVGGDLLGNQLPMKMGQGPAEGLRRGRAWLPLFELSGPSMADRSILSPWGEG